MRTSDENSGAEPPRSGLSRLDRLPAGVVIVGALLVPVVIVAFVVVLLFWSWTEPPPDDGDRDGDCCWAEGVTPAWMSDQIGIRMPESAADRRAGYKPTAMYDVGLLSFVLPAKDAERYLGRLKPKNEKLLGNAHPEPKGYSPSVPFARLGLTEPETLTEGIRRTTLCPDDLNTPEGRHLHVCIDLFAHETGPDTTRLYIRGTFETPVTPPPVSTAPSAP
jgi:hypothetical protein